ncbi:ScbA/BarX family gamma-butyrolactone biosynthesis protein [Streptomyces sp. B6B3]|uniref:ScbA/BarX family gamma-butyrolactone biosynthesis protein n=1 Tax=Streptomyces sp. B6B3 TaxID=3153570 RepID=UPI00325F38C2
MNSTICSPAPPLPSLSDEPPTTLGHLTSAVPREYVHKAAIAEVLLTDWNHTGGETFAIAAQWPREHSFYTDGNHRYDPLLFAETVRQTLPLLSHVAYRVPIGHHLIWDHLHYDIHGADALAIGPRPADVALRVRCFDIARRGGRIAALSLRVEALRDGAPLGTAETRFTCHTPAVYRRLRGGRAGFDPTLGGMPPAPAPVPARHAGHERRRNVVLSATDAPRRWQLRADTSHPVLFDHPVDHVPGALLLEAARQATLVLTRPAAAVVVGMRTTFRRFVELDAPCWIEAAPGPDDRTVHVTARQSGEEPFSAVVTTELTGTAARESEPLAEPETG